jgi:hypothetical protein
MVIPIASRQLAVVSKDAIAYRRRVPQAVVMEAGARAGRAANFFHPQGVTNISRGECVVLGLTAICDWHHTLS